MKTKYHSLMMCICCIWGGLSTGCVTTTSYNGNTTNHAEQPLTTQPSPFDIMGQWQLLDIPEYTRSRYRSAYRDFTLNIEPHHINGSAGNYYNASADWGAGRVRITSDLASTRKLVRGDKGQMEKVFFHRLSSISQWQMDEQGLVLSGRNGALIFQRP